MKVSYSAISTFLQCPEAYAFRYRDGLRVVKPAAHFEVGSIIHAAFDPILTAHAFGEKLPDSEMAVRIGCAKIREKYDMTPDSEEHAQHAVRALDYHVPRMRLESWETLVIDGKAAVELELEVPFAGATLMAHIDWIARSKESGKVWVIDHKTSKHRMKDQPWIEHDLQLALYREATRLAGIETDGSMLHQLCYIPPNDPKPLKRSKNGRIFSVAKNQRTTWEAYQNALIQHGQDPADYLDVKDMLLDQEIAAPFRRWAPDVTGAAGHAALLAQAEHAVSRMRAVKESGAPTTPNRVGEWSCGRCEYRSWCDAKMLGLDPRSLLLTVYQPDDDSPYLGEHVNASDTAALRRHTARMSATGVYDMWRFDPHKA